MQMLKTKSGIKYREKVYIDGKPFYSPRFDRKTDAKEWKARLLVERQTYLATGKKVEPLDARDFKTIGFKDYATNWVENRVKVRNSRRTYDGYKSILNNHLFPFLKNRPMDQISMQDADRLSRTLQEKGHNAKGINMIFGILKRVFIEAVRDGDLEKNPLMYLRDLKEKPRPDVFLTDMEIKQFLAASQTSHLYPLFLVAVNTGMRKGELAGLCWDRVNFETNLIEITRTRDRMGLEERLKTVTSRRHVPMNMQVRRMLMEMRGLKTASEFIFLDPDGEPFDVHHLYRDFHGALRKAKIARQIRFHDLRHTFASHFMMKGGNIYDLQKILGHSSLEMTQRYAHLAPEHLVRAINVVNFSSSPDEVLEENSAKTGPAAVLALKR